MMRNVRILFFIVAVGCLAWFAWQSRELLLGVLATARPHYLLVSVGLWLLMNGVAAAFATHVFRGLGVDVPYSRAAHIHIANLPARYVPGGIWHTVGRAASYRQQGIAAKDIAVFVFLENVLAVCVAFVIGGTILGLTREADTWRQVAILCAIAGAIFLVLSPLLLSRFGRLGAVRFPAGQFVLLALITALSWCIAAAAFVNYLAAFPDVSASLQPVEVAGSYLFSWGIGFVSIFAPQGIGVFEVVAADLLRDSAPLMGTAALLAGFRFVILAADSVAFVTQQTLSRSAIGQRRDLLGDEPDQENNH